MTKHYERKGGVLTAVGRAQRKVDRDAVTSARDTSIRIQNEAANKAYVPGEGAENYEITQHANDTGRDESGTSNRPELTNHNRGKELTGYKSMQVNKALKDAGVGADD